MQKEIDVKALRDALGLKQEELSRKLGIGVWTVSSWETGKHHPSPVMRRKLERLQRKVKNGD